MTKIITCAELRCLRLEGVVKVTGLRRRVARHALSRATIYAAFSRFTVKHSTT